MHKSKVIKYAAIIAITFLVIYFLLFAPLPSSDIDTENRARAAGTDNNLWDIERSLTYGIPSAHFRGGYP